MICGYCNVGKIEEAFTLLERMKLMISLLLLVLVLTCTQIVAVWKTLGLCLRWFIIELLRLGMLWLDCMESMARLSPQYNFLRMQGEFGVMKWLWFVFFLHVAIVVLLKTVCGVLGSWRKGMELSLTESIMLVLLTSCVVMEGS